MVEIHEAHKARYEQMKKESISMEIVEDGEHFDEYFNKIFNSEDPHLSNLRDQFEDWDKNPNYHRSALHVLKEKMIMRDRHRGTPMTILAGEVSYSPDFNGKPTTFVFALGRVDDPEHEFFDSWRQMSISGFDDAAEPLREIESLKYYKAKGLEIQPATEKTHKNEDEPKNCPVITCNASVESRFEEIHSKDGMLSWEDYFNKEYQSMDIKALNQEDNLSSHPHDFRLVKDLILMSGTVRTRNEGEQFGLMEFEDDSLSIKEASERDNTLTIFTEPHIATRWNRASTFHILGVSKAGNYGVNLMPKVILPIAATEKPQDEIITPSGPSTEEESASVAYLKNKLKKEPKKETKKEPKKEEKKVKVQEEKKKVSEMNFDEVKKDFVIKGSYFQNAREWCEEYGYGYDEEEDMCADECDFSENCKKLKEYGGNE